VLSVGGTKQAQVQIDELKWELIIDRLHCRRYVPFVGAAANIRNEARYCGGLPLGNGVVHAIATRLRYGEGSLPELA
jgi:hypothetical protein